MAKKTRTAVPTATEIKRLAKAHTKAEDALRHAEIRVLVAKRSQSKRR